jgi:uncharacterized membrane protein
VHVLKAGRLALAAATAGLGIVSLAFADFALQWQPVPATLPARHALALASGAFLVACGVALALDRFAARAAIALSAYQTIWVVARATEPIAAPASIGRWLGFAEALALLIGSFLLCAAADRAEVRRTARIVFGACCVVFGLSHFKYADFTAGMIPPWLPARTALAYVTGACHLAAGLALITSVQARLAARLEALMLASFVLLVHAPTLVAMPPPAWAPSSQVQWVALFIALAMTGSAAVVSSDPRSR